MIKTIIICDKCKRQMEEQDDLNINGMDFCPKCTSKLFLVIQKWVAPEIEEEKAEVKKITEEKKEKKAEPAAVDEEEPKRKIDWDKACALKIAGWNNADIAAECHIKLSTLSAEIYKKLKVYNEKRAEEEKKAKSDVANPWGK